MSTRPYTEISCDAANCSNAVSDRGHAYDVRHRAAGEGWKVGSKGDYCPEHKTRASRMEVKAP